MVEYTFDEAIQLLTKSTESIARILAEADEDLAFLKDQITTMEVTIARIYNYDIMSKRIKNQQAAAGSNNNNAATSK